MGKRKDKVVVETLRLGHVREQADGVWVEGWASAKFDLPKAVLGECVAVFGRRGSGKTNTAGVLFELAELVGQQRIVFDPLDAWWGVKFDAEGRPRKEVAGTLLIAGNPRKKHTDVALTEEMAEPLADLLVERRWSAVLSMQHLSRNAQRRFVAKFVRRFMLRKGEPGMNSSVTLFWEEAHVFMPQSAGGGDLEMLGAVQSSVLEGRFLGIGHVMVDQRPAHVNTGTRNQAEVLVVHQVTAPHDRKAIKEWLEEHDDNGSGGAAQCQLSKLARGEAYVFSPVLLGGLFRVQVDKRLTFDSTVTPEVGAEAVAVGDAEAAKFDTGVLEEALGEATAHADEFDPVKLRVQREALRSDVAALESRLESAVSMRDQAAAKHRGELCAAVKAEGERWASLVKSRDGWWLERLRRVQRFLGDLVVNVSVNVDAPAVGLRPGGAVVKNGGDDGTVTVGAGGGEAVGRGGAGAAGVAEGAAEPIGARSDAGGDDGGSRAKPSGHADGGGRGGRRGGKTGTRESKGVGRGQGALKLAGARKRLVVALVEGGAGKAGSVGAAADVSGGTLWRELKVLREGRLVKRRKDGVYAVTAAGRKAVGG